MDFDQFTYEIKSKMFTDKTTTVLKVKREYLGFENIEDEIPINENHYIEIPPIILDRKMYQSILQFSSQDQRGYWITTMYRTYIEGGRVWYRKIDNDFFEVKLIFDGSLPGPLF